MESLEVSAKSVDEAIDIALEKLGVRASEVEITVLSSGRSGILGIGAEDARVRVTKLDLGRTRMSSADFPPRPPVISYATDRSVFEDDEEDLIEAQRPLSPPPAPPQQRGQRDRGRDRGPRRDREAAQGREGNRERDRDRDRGPAQGGRRDSGQQRQAPRAAQLPQGKPATGPGAEVLGELLRRLGFDCGIVEVEPPALGAGANGAAIAYDIRGEDLGVLIGRRGQTLASLQYLVNLIVSRQHKDAGNVVIDVEGYRSRRYQALRGLAQRMADRVRSTGQPVTLEPMNAAERRIVHMTLQDVRDVTTQSMGEGDNRKVSIVPRRRGQQENRG